MAVGDSTLKIELGYVTSLRMVSKVSSKSQADRKTQFEVRVRVILEYSAPA